MVFVNVTIKITLRNVNVVVCIFFLVLSDFMKKGTVVVIGYSEDALERRERLLANKPKEKPQDVLKTHVSSLGRLWSHYERDFKSLRKSATESGCSV